MARVARLAVSNPWLTNLPLQRAAAMPNLAAFRYRHVLAEHGGPIASIEVSDTTVLGRRQFQANVRLRPDLVAWRNGGDVFSDASGSGTASSPMVARFKGVSEALERWAHMSLCNSGRCGFDADPSSNGMAAFPGLFAREARRRAALEAAERFNLLAWCEGRLTAQLATTPWPEVHAAVLQSAAPGITVILYRRSAEGHYCYGHAAATNFSTACASAAVEMDGHDAVVQHHRLAHAGRVEMSALPDTAHPIERRSLFFASEEGHACFLEKLHAPARRACPHPRAIFDGPVRGPWSRYADVWRVAYAPLSYDYLSSDPTYFFW